MNHIYIEENGDWLAEIEHKIIVGHSDEGMFGAFKEAMFNFNKERKNKVKMGDAAEKTDERN